jgi:uncharacterized protein YaiI (UPF0178 family)
MMSTSIWSDADACPKVVKQIIFRAAERTGVTVTLVANRPLTIPRIPSVRLLQVVNGFDVADNEIFRCSAAGDLVITADISPAAEAIADVGGGPPALTQADRSAFASHQYKWLAQRTKN